MSGRRGAFLILILTVGLLGARLFEVDSVYLSSVYHFFVLGLLAVGLYGSTRDIDLRELRSHLPTVLLAVTVGVLAKVALISGVLLLLYPEPASLVLGVAVAQIDPLAVAAAQRRDRMSASTRTVLNSWAAFDDPVTVLLTVYLSTFALRAQGIGAGGEAGQSLAAFLTNLMFNLVFAAVAFVVWRIAKGIGLSSWLASDTARARIGQAVVAVIVLGYAAFGVWQSLMLGIALTGLFFRPYARWKQSAQGILFGALVVATGALGVVIASTTELLTVGRLVEGVLLGCAAYAAQMVTGWAIARKHAPIDRLHIVLGQQNGLTAIILALALEPDFRGAVAVIAPAIVVTNVLYGLGSRYIRSVERKTEDEHEPAEVTSKPSLPDPLRVPGVPRVPSPAPVRRVPDTAS